MVTACTNLSKRATQSCAQTRPGRSTLGSSLPEASKKLSLVVGFGDPEEEFSRYLALDSDHVVLWLGIDNTLSGPATLAPNKWHFLAATFDGEAFSLYSDGAPIATGKLDLEASARP